jgi:hypothetical protein
MRPSEVAVLREPGIERRRHPRIETRIDAHGSAAEGGAIARMVTDNLSLAGLQCTSATDFPEMTRLAVRLLLPGSDGNAAPAEPIDIEAVVVRRTHLAASNEGKPRYQLALFFTSMDDSAKERLTSYIGSL